MDEGDGLIAQQALQQTDEDIAEDEEQHEQPGEQHEQADPSLVTAGEDVGKRDQPQGLSASQQ